MVCFPYADIRQKIISQQTPQCSKCHQPLRPHIMFFDQFYTEKFNHADSVRKFMQEADLLIVIGTSLQTGLARNVVEEFIHKKKPIVEINTSCIIRHSNNLWMEGKSEEFLIKISNNLY